MINFIICDDEQLFLNSIVEVIDKVMMSNDFAYTNHLFCDYNEDFDNIINDKLSFKIYILDIQVNSKSGIDIAKKIRKNDIESMIIFCTAYFEKYLKEIIRSRFMFLDFIDKSGDYKNNLVDTINYALSNINKKNIIRFKNQNIVYTIYTNDILYIMRDKDRKCIIKVSDIEIVVNKSLVEIKSMLDNRFVYSHRACIINMSRIYNYDKKTRIITFDNNVQTDLVSTRFKMKYK